MFDFFEEQVLTPQLLRVVNQHQLGVLARSFDAIGADPGIIARNLEMDLRDVGGFLALETPYAQRIYEGLHKKGVVTDHRGDYLRLGPAPYHSDEQLQRAIAILAGVLDDL